MIARRCIASLALVAACALPVTAGAAELTADPSHTSANFSVKHLTLTTVSGSIGVKSATLDTAADNTLTSVAATLDLSTIDTKFAQRDDDLRSDHWFDVAKYPEMTFKSTKVTPGKDGMTVAGDLTFHGVTKPVVLIAKYEDSVKDSRGRTHVGYTATGTIDRTQWNLGTNYPPAVVGDDITITLEFEAVES